jgi:hypothetical protein
MPRRLLALSMFCGACAASAEPVALTGQSIRDTVAGATIELDTPVGTRMPIRYQGDGQLSAEAGKLSWYLGSATDQGEWWIADDRLCQRMTKWFDRETQCLRLRKEGRQLLWRRDDGRTGTATIISRSAELAQRSGAQSALGVDPSAAQASAPIEDKPDKAPMAATTARPLARATPDRAKPAVVPDRAPVAVVAPKPVAPKIAAAPPAKTMPLPAKSPASPPSPQFRVAGVDAADILNVRSGPSTDHIPVAAIAADARQIRIVGPCAQEWCVIEHGSISGWVNRMYLVEETLGDRPSQPAYGAGRATR